MRTLSRKIRILNMDLKRTNKIRYKSYQLLIKSIIDMYSEKLHQVVMISASHEGCCGTFPMYPPIRLYCSRCSMVNMLSILMMLDNKHVKYTHNTRWRTYWVYSRYLMTNILNILTILNDKYIKYIHKHLYSTRNISILEYHI